MQTFECITVAICARNAAATIERAIRSVTKYYDCPILLVDDFSVDETAKIARRVGDGNLSVVHPANKKGIGNARQTAIENIKTPYGMWLDADDEIMPTRIEHMHAELHSNDYTLVFDAAELWDGVSGQKTGDLPLHDFLQAEGGIWRLFERNWLPGLWGGFNSEFARSIGYDPAFLNGEDYDFTLRAITAGANVSFSSKKGYKYYHYPNTVSRNLDQAMSFSDAALKKHSSTSFTNILNKTQLDKSEKHYLQACISLLSGNPADAIKWAEKAFGIETLLEPYQRSLTSLTHYLAATGYLQQAQPLEALALFNTQAQKNAETYNNIGVCHWLLNDHSLAKDSFESALHLLPGYVDAVENLGNLGGDHPPRITLLPLRPTPSRSSYGSP